MCTGYAWCVYLCTIHVWGILSVCTCVCVHVLCACIHLCFGYVHCVRESMTNVRCEGPVGVVSTCTLDDLWVWSAHAHWRTCGRGQHMHTG